MSNKVKFSELSSLDKITVMFLSDPETYRKIVMDSGAETALAIMELDAIDRIKCDCEVEEI